ncbi:MAG TPA: CPBP family intramembrane glutamic endopeptidase [Candidatus Dormibacteraeota bacterium]|nr:CPBP family intramembrane glutamic endopeptidase [Candidatus Dormibacteraeota bacterium]
MSNLIAARGMPATAEPSVEEARRLPRQLPALQLVALGLAPGAAGAVVYVALAAAVTAAGYPPIAALLIAIVIAIVPIEVGALVVARRVSRPRAEPLIPYRRKTPWRTVAWLVPLLLLAAVAGSVALTPVDGVLQTYVFGGLPGWFKNPLDVNAVGAYSRSAWITTLAVYMVLNGVAGPIVEELYFRGWLLPRMERYGRWAPLFNACLFSLYHFWMPWGFLSRVAAVAPYIYAVRWRRNIYIGIAVHILLNCIGGLLVVAQIASRL